MNTPTHFRERRLHFRLVHDLPDVRRTNFLFAFRHHHQVHRHLFARALDRMQRREKRRFRSLLIHRAATDDRLSSPGLSTSAASSGGDVHSLGSNCFTSYMK